MIARLASPLLVFATAPVLVAADAPRSLDGTQSAQVMLHERVIIRIPRVIVRQAVRSGNVTTTRPIPLAAWEEKKAPRCLATATLTGASLSGAGDVDLIVQGVRRVRAKLENDCPTLDLYSGFYLRQTKDGNICARRDVIRSRSGARCAIRDFRTLVAKR